MKLIKFILAFLFVYFLYSYATSIETCNSDSYIEGSPKISTYKIIGCGGKDNDSYYPIAEYFEFAGCGYVDSSINKWIIRPRYKGCGDFSENGFAIIAEKNSKQNKDYSYSNAYFINKKGRYLFRDNIFLDKTQYIHSFEPVSVDHTFYEGLMIVKFRGGYSYINKLGTLEFSYKTYFNEVRNYSGGFAAVKLNEKWGYINKSGDFLVKPKFDYAGDFTNEVARVSINKKTGFINSNGHIVSMFDDMGFIYKENIFISFKKNDKWGFIDNKGNVIISPKFDKVGGFSDGVAAFKENNKWGYINMIGEQVISPQFDGAGMFSNGKATVGIGYDLLRGHGHNHKCISKEGLIIKDGKCG